VKAHGLLSSFIFYRCKILSFLRCQAGPSRCNEHEPSLTENRDQIDLASHRTINTKLHRYHLGISIPKSICVPSCALAPWQPPPSSLCNSKRRHRRRCTSPSLGNWSAAAAWRRRPPYVLPDVWSSKLSLLGSPSRRPSWGHRQSCSWRNIYVVHLLPSVRTPACCQPPRFVFHLTLISRDLKHRRLREARAIWWAAAHLLHILISALTHVHLGENLITFSLQFPSRFSMLIVVAALWHRYPQINNASAAGNDRRLKDSLWSHSWSTVVSIWCLITSSSMFAHRCSPAVILIVGRSHISCRRPCVSPATNTRCATHQRWCGRSHQEIDEARPPESRRQLLAVRHRFWASGLVRSCLWWELVLHPPPSLYSNSTMCVCVSVCVL
jgi:hypothetical protein